MIGDEIWDAVDRAKAYRNQDIDRFHKGDVVAPIPQAMRPWIWGVVIRVDHVAHKVIIDLNGIEMQYCPNELFLGDPKILKKANRKASTNSKIAMHNQLRATAKRIKASARKAMYYIDKPSVFKVSQNEIEEGVVRCPKCKELMTLKYIKDENTMKYVCSKCGRTILMKKVRYNNPERD